MVKEVNVKDCLMEKDAIKLLDSNFPEVKYECTVSPLQVANELGASSNCTQNFARYLSPMNPSGDVTPPGVETTGAIMLALVSSFILIVVVLFLFMMQRQGKLDQYL